MENVLAPIRPLAVVLFLAASALAESPATVPSMAPMRPASTVPATQSAEQKAVVAALDKYNAAVESGDVATLNDFVTASTPQQRSAVGLMGRLTTVGRAMYAAVIGQYGDAAAKADGVEKGSFPAGFPALPTDAMDVRVEGDTATLVNRMAAEAKPLSMKKSAGAWRLDGDALLPPMTDKQLAQQSTVLDAAMGAIEQATADVKAGHFRSADEAVVVMNHRVQKAVQAAQMKLAAAEDAATSQPATMPAK